MRFDDTWFIQRRARLLDRVAHPGGEARHAHMARSIIDGSRLSGPVDKSTEGALAHLAPRHRSAARAHMQFYRGALEVFGFLPSDAIVNAAVQIEWLWYTTPFKPFYRDHLAHVMKVALIALDLLDHDESPFTERGVTLLDRVSRNLAARKLGAPRLRIAARRAGIHEAALEDEAFWREAVRETVRLAGLLHDMAYPDVMVVKVETAAKAVRPRSPFESGLDDVCRAAVGMLQNHLVGSPFHGGELPGPKGIDEKSRGIAERVFHDGHSLRAGYSILRMLEDARRVGVVTPFDAFVMEWAALATSLHDYDKFFKKKDDNDVMEKWLEEGTNRASICPDFDQDPVSFLVAFADQLQDFGRMNYEPQDHGSDLASSRVHYPVAAVELAKNTDGSIALTFELGAGKGGPFAPKDDKTIRDVAEDKHKAAAFAETKWPGAPKPLPPWLVPGSLYTTAGVRVTHDKTDYDAKGQPIPPPATVTAPPASAITL